MVTQITHLPSPLKSAAANPSYGVYLLLVLVAIVLAAAIVLAIRSRKSGFSGGSGVDKLTGLGDKNHARRHFSTMERTHTDLACLAYIAMDPARLLDAHGREKCDELQRSVGELLSTFCGETDSAARIDDGVFTVGISCHSGLATQQRINDLIDHLNQREAALVGETVAPFRAGLFFDTMDSCGFDAALRNAVLAYGHACENQRNLCVCTEELLKNETYRNYLRERLSRAIDDKQFDMFLQFIYNTAEKKFTCAEVLSRWNNPLEGFLMPAYYINDMRNTGVIKKFDLYMLDKTCHQLEAWSKTPLGTLRLSCNVNRVTISAPDFVQEFQAILKKYKFDHAHLMLEITEDALIDKAVAYQNILFCKSEGIGIAIDDLFAGHSTLEDVSDYPIDQIKLDRHMIVRTTSKRGNTLLRELITMAHRMELEIVCEGVETVEQRDAVVDNGCDFVQGYFYSYVLPLEEGKEFFLKSLQAPSLPMEQ